MAIKSEYKVDLNDIYDKYYVGLYGVNERLREALRKFSDEGDGSSIVFYEYLLHQPIPFIDGLTGKHEKDDKNKNLIKLTKHIYLLAPFATRMVEMHNIVPTYNDKWGLDYKSNKSLSDVRLFFKLPSSHFTKISYMIMAAENSEVSEIRDGVKMQIQWLNPGTDADKPAGYYAQTYFKPSETIVRYREEHKHDPLSLESVEKLDNLFKIIFPHTFYENDNIYGLVIPISSNRYFYGCLWLMCFRHRNMNSMKEKEYERNLVKTVKGIVSSHYVPVMSLLHEHISEDLFSSKKEKNSEEIYRIPFAVEGLTIKNVGGSNEIIETEFERLWKKRRELLGKKENIPINNQMILKTLLFKNYMVASETMIELVRSIISAARNMKKSSSSLPAALVIGGAGSGKDTLSKMLRIFTDDYFEGEEYTINLAAIKPSALVPAVMTGAAYKIFEETDFQDYITKDSVVKTQYFEGFFQKIRKGIIGKIVDGLRTADNKVEAIKQFVQEDKEKKEEDKFKGYPTLILDEFNSMDSESQGVLLRFIENSEVVSLGSLRNGSEFKDVHADVEFLKSLSDLTNCLIIGVMNEDPDDISREKAIDFLKGNNYLGGVLGDMLYEHFIKIRRLRPDIKYRMMRNGRFVIKPLKERREDIPILFQVYLGKVKIKDKEKTPHLSLDAMERLTARDIAWPGNIRQLQALAKHVSELIHSEIGADRQIEIAVVERRHIDIGLENIGLKDSRDNAKTGFTR